MSLSQQIRDALRAIGGSTTSADLAEHMGVERSAISGHLTAMEKSGVILVDRSEKPFTITLDKERAKETESRGAPTVEAKPPKAKRTPTKRASKAAKPKASPTRRGRKPRTAAAAEQQVHAEVIQLERSLAMRLAVLALSSRDPMSDDDRLSIASVIKAAA